MLEKAARELRMINDDIRKNNEAIPSDMRRASEDNQRLRKRRQLLMEIFKSRGKSGENSKIDTFHDGASI